MNQRLLSLAIALVALGMGGKTACMNQSSGEELAEKIQQAAPLLTRLYNAYEANQDVVKYPECINQQKASLAPDDLRKIEEERTKLMNIMQKLPNRFCAPGALQDMGRRKSCAEVVFTISLLSHGSSLGEDKSAFHRVSPSFERLFK